MREWVDKADNLRRVDLKREILKFKQLNLPPEEKKDLFKQSVFVSLQQLIEVYHYVLALEKMDIPEKPKVMAVSAKIVLEDMIKKSSGVEDIQEVVDQDKINSFL